MTDFSNPTFLTGRGLPSPTDDNVRGPQRGSRFGDSYGIDLFAGRSHGLADEGSYFYSQHPTIDASTTVAGHAAPVLADLYTKPFLVITNSDVTSSKKRTYLDWIEITVITAGATGSSDNWAAECDTGGAAARYSSGTLVRLTTVNPNMQSTSANATVADCGPYVAKAATGSQRKMGSGVFRPSIALTGDKYLFTFGAPPQINGVVASAITQHFIPLAPVILGPSDLFLLHLYAPSQNAAAVYKVQCGWWER
jgi:hypothetical protein